MNKQDLNGTRTAQDLEQKYKLGTIPDILRIFQDNKQVLENLGLDLSSLNTSLTETQENLSTTNADLKQAKNDIIQTKNDLSITNSNLATTNEELSQAKTDIKNANTTLNNFVSSTMKTLSELQNEIDGSITSFYNSGVPTLDNYPSIDWNSDEYNLHLGDLYYDKETGYSYRFYLDHDVYQWVRITDSDVTRALALANSAKDTADNKRRVFMEQPEPPYDSGDLWVNDGDLFICQISRDTGTYETDDFISSLNYTDDTYARVVEEGLSSSLEVVSGRVTRIEEDTSEFKITTEERIESIQNETNEVTESLKQMSYSFGTDDLQISKLDDPTSLRMNNKGLKIYNMSRLMAIFNKNGSGMDKLIVVKSFQFQNLLLRKRQITRPDTEELIDVISCFWLENLIESLSDLEV